MADARQQLAVFCVCRWKRDEDGERIIHPESGKPVLQFVAVLRRDCGEWALPGVSTLNFCRVRVCARAYLQLLLCFFPSPSKSPNERFCHASPALPSCQG